MRNARARLVGWYQSALHAWISNRLWDWLATLLLVGVHYGLHRWRDAAMLISSTGADLTDDLRFVVNVLATMSGFLLTAVVFFYGMEGGMRLRIAEQAIGDKIAGAWRGGVVTALVSMTALGAASFKPSTPGAWLGEVLVVFVALRVTRLVKVLFDFIDLYRSDQADPGVPTTRVEQPTIRR